MKSTLWRGLCFSALAVLFAIPAFAGELKLSINSGRVTIIATDVPIAQVLQEWARVGQTRIVNGDRIMGPPITVQLVNVPEKEALDIILRSASGYVAAPRSELVTGTSMYDRIMVMATSIAPPPSSGPVAAPPPSFRPAMPSPVDDDDEEPVNIPPTVQAPPQTAPFGPMPTQQAAPPPQGQGAPGPTLSATPGVVVGAPANGQPGQVNPNQPPVVKPGGGGGGGA
jgi:hypothetical protein